VNYWVRTLRIRDIHEPHQLKEIATVVQEGLVLLGLEAYFTHRQCPGWGTNAELAAHERQIIIGGNCGTPPTLATIPDNSVVYNFEQAGNFHFSPEYVRLLQRCEVWDYNLANIERLKRYAVHARYVPFGFVPGLEHEYVKGWDQDEYDVMFVGSLHVSSPRSAIINDLKHSGLRVFASEACYGEARAEAYQKSKVVLNMHFHKEKIMETVRVATAMANHKAVVCQVDSDTSVDERLIAGMACVPYGDLVGLCIKLVQNESERRRLERAGYETFTQLKMDDILRPIINEPQKSNSLPQDFERTPDPRLPVYRKTYGAG
jgi:hypothetical protein